MNDQVRHFQEMLGPLERDFQSAETRIAAFTRGPNWVNLATRATLTTKPPSTEWFDLTPPGLTDLLVRGTLLPLEGLPALLQVFETGMFRAGELDVSYRSNQESGLGPPYSPFFRTYRRDSARQYIGVDAHCFVLSGDESASKPGLDQDRLERLESTLADLKRPFSGIGDFVRTLVGTPRLHGNWTYGSLEIIAPIWFRFLPTTAFVRDAIRVEASFDGGLNAGRAAVGVIQREGGRVVRRSKHRFSVRRTKRGHDVLLVSDVRANQDVSSALAQLTYGGVRVDSTELFRNLVSGMNPRMAAVSSVDPDLRRFHQGLRGEVKTQGGGFEQSFLELMEFLGFSCLHTGYASANPDLLAWAIDPSVVFVIECTTGEPDLRNKATKFAARLRYVGAKSHVRMPVGILATTLQRDAINPAELERLKADNVILVESAALEKLLPLAERGAGVGEALQLFQDLASDQQLTFRKLVPWEP